MIPVKISNIRFGFATNSSSTHSIIMFKDNSIVENIREESSQDDHQFGWEEFVLKSKDDKLDYFITLLKGNLVGFHNSYRNENTNAGVNKKEKIINDILKKINCNYTYIDEEYIDAYIDHQSMIYFPDNYTTQELDIDFLKIVYEIFMRDDVVIFGGNDNSDGPTYNNIINRMGKNDVLNITDILDGVSGYGNSYILYNDAYDYWTAWIPSNGKKFRFSFNLDAKEYTKSLFPELIDIKITDMCNFNCSFCYQSSTNNGKHAKLEDIKKIAKSLKGRTFEVALGGGDPMQHPDLIDILKCFRDNDVVPNFSTKDVSWIQHDSSNMAEILRLTGSIGISIRSVNELSLINDYITSEFKTARLEPKHNSKYSGDVLDKIFNKYKKIKYHYIIGTEPAEDFQSLLQYAYDNNIDLLLLGYKDVGRGKHFKPYNFDWVSVVKSVIKYMGNIGIDTLLTKDIKDNDEIKKCTYTTKEGMFSMYLDLVNMKMASCSYCEPSEMINFTLDNKDIDEISNEIKTIFQKF